ncbi:His-Xaa-Ser system radical SAM maturase HxsC [Rubrivivax gelatinosus]|uniref:His-Xaa-Ser system radical SAM maturase HxsC n=1 Tax=Rubrivivax gelatinosus TaxID=28068 RepID=A0A4R2MAT0_RUBGE|nr:His-Xaa-Ser system radical SAM maturase HxsC [Rubrivivax gelatinosus]MBK1686323.1 His-Xaa-Ser system radical SAM maturase HxsC [Rubrivivax gelatinosus]TCP04459.1 His-Xaa-Ser system radical SAM maturase HxsC [Rubrivivax gelatinosus]
MRRLNAGEAPCEGDVVRRDARSSRVEVLYRESDRHHALLLTNRCNNHCLMCSQPPTSQDDGWLVDQAFEVLSQIRSAPASLGLTGGEPLLLGLPLRALLQAIGERFPSTSIEVLSNGRALCDAAFASALLDGLPSRVSWLVPLYGPADFVHDFVVQAPGAFDETVAGLLALRAHRQPVQLRIVLIRPVLDVLVELCRFIGRNLPFVREVALMACEPIGFALANRALCELDLAAEHSTLLAATRELERFRIPFVLMNTPLCTLPQRLWPSASRSISDWKQQYVAECERCTVSERCCGLFAWHSTGWRPGAIRPIEGGVT